MNGMMGSGVMQSLSWVGPLVILWTLLWLAVLDLALVAYVRMFPGNKYPTL